MWQTVRQELAHLHWEVEPSLTLDLMADWTRTVASLLTVRRALGPLATTDPLALLATATTGAARTPDLKPVLAQSLDAVATALARVGTDVQATSGVDRQREAATLNHVAYELAHWVRIRTPDDRARTWLQAGETALDGAIHAPAGRSTLGVGLAAWQDALATVQPVHDAPIVRRSVALGHLAILRTTHALVNEAMTTGALPGPYADALLGHVGDLARAHQKTLGGIDGRSLGASRVDQAVMLKVGTAVRQLTGRPDPAEPVHVQLDALLRSGLGQAVLVAQLTGESAARQPAAGIGRLTLDYLTNPRILRPVGPPDLPAPAAPVNRAPKSEPESRVPAPAPPVESSIRPGTILDGPAILALCRARDLGVAAGNADPANPPELLRGTDPTRWPQLGAEGRQAVADLVASVVPMVYAQTRRSYNETDVRGQAFVELMGAAYRFDPERNGPEGWAPYAWMTIKHSRLSGVDDAGVVRRRTTSPRPANMTLEGHDPASRTPDPGDIVEQRESVQSITQTLHQLPTSLREPLLESMEGHPIRTIAEDHGYSQSTAHRRVAEARAQLREELAPHADDGTWVPFDEGIDPVLERAQRLYESILPQATTREPDRNLGR